MFHAGSIAKTFTAAAILNLAAEHTLQLDAGDHAALKEWREVLEPTWTTERAPV